jgi:hypothetical protein
MLKNIYKNFNWLSIKFFKKHKPALIDNKFRRPRIWSNKELIKFGHLFTGCIINVSGWTDTDKEGKFYRDYFYNAKQYSITNYNEDDDRGIQGSEGEIPLNLEDELDSSLIKQFDVAFNHTVLEHIFEVRKAFSNICKISSDVVITVVPYLQQLHGINDNVGDYWRFTPLTMKQLYEENGLKLRYCSANGDTSETSIYLFCIGYRSKYYDEKIPYRFDLKIDANSDFSITNAIGANIIP